MLSILVFLTLSQTALSEDVAWKVDKNHSRVGFTVTHMGINDVHGVFKKYDATIIADKSTGKLSAVTASVEVASIDTDIDKRDEHLRSQEIFNAKAYPKMTIETGTINWKGKSFSGWAKLTIKGKTQPVKYSGKLTGLKEVTEDGKKVLRVGYHVTAKINRKKFGIVFGRFSEGLSMVSEMVTIKLDIETVRK
jgi:polyisoprenoid-binding protein YceI